MGKKKLDFWLYLVIFFFLSLISVFISRGEIIVQDVYIGAIVQPWLYLEVSPVELTLSPDLVTVEGELNIAESEEIVIKVGTSNPGGWEIKMRGKNNGLISPATNYLISSVKNYSSLVLGKEGYGAQATSVFEGVVINSIYDFYGTNIVGEISNQDYKSLAKKLSANSLNEVAKMKIKASASFLTPAGYYEDEIILTIIPLI